MAVKQGRPTKYNEERISQVDEYLQACQDEYFDWVKTDGANSTSYERKLTVKLPTFEGFASFINVNISSVELWGRKYPDFSRALEKIMVEQRARLVEKGLSGDYNSTIAKLILSANHGMKERTDVTSDDKQIQPLAGFEYVLPKTNNTNSTVE